MEGANLKCNVSELNSVTKKKKTWKVPKTPQRGVPGYAGYVPQTKFRAGETQGKSYFVFQNNRFEEAFVTGYRLRPGTVPRHLEPIKYVFEQIPVKLSQYETARHQEIANFYENCQYHRDMYRDLTGTEPEISYFKIPPKPVSIPPYPSKSFYISHNKEEDPANKNDAWAFSRQLSERSYGGCKDYLGRLAIECCRSRTPRANYDVSRLHDILYGYR